MPARISPLDVHTAPLSPSQVQAILAGCPPFRMTKAQQEEATRWYILASLRNATFVERALEAIYNRQTADEQDARTTVEHNGMGFNGTDADFLTDICQKMLENRWGRPEGSRLTDGQRKAVAKCLQKYWRQLAEVARSKGPKGAPAPTPAPEPALAAVGALEVLESPADAYEPSGDDCDGSLDWNARAAQEERQFHYSHRFGSRWSGRRAGWYGA